MAHDAYPRASQRDSQAATAENLAALRADLLRFARLHLRDSEAAEDMVQDALEAALRNAKSFAGRSTLKTWMFAILRNRIVDHIRESARTVSFSSLVPDDADAHEQIDAFFDQAGRWADEVRPTPWPRPEQQLQDREFWRVFEACLDHLPANTARVFTMREFLGFDSAEICSHVGITSGNCHVILHRARLKLRHCMEQGWGRPGAAPC